MRTVAATAPGGVLGGKVSGEGATRDGVLGQGAAAFGGESTDRSGDWVSRAPAAVRSQCHGGIVGDRFCRGRKRPPLSLLRSSSGAQSGFISASAGALAGSVPGTV